MANGDVLEIVDYSSCWHLKYIWIICIMEIKGRCNMSSLHIGQRIRELREIQHYSRDFFAEKVGITAQFLYEIETGKKGLSASTLGKIASVLEVSSDYILFGASGERQGTERIVNVLEGMDEKQKLKIREIIVLIEKLLE